jgi:hypothetical protein
MSWLSPPFFSCWLLTNKEEDSQSSTLTLIHITHIIYCSSYNTFSTLSTSFNFSLSILPEPLINELELGTGKIELISEMEN